MTDKKPTLQDLQSGRVSEGDFLASRDYYAASERSARELRPPSLDYDRGYDDGVASLLAAAKALLATHDRPHGFADEHWYQRHVDALRAAIADVEGRQ